MSAGGVSERSLPDTINGEKCLPFSGNACASCIISLENQGCTIVDVIVTHFRKEGEATTVPGTSYLLSCIKP